MSLFGHHRHHVLDPFEGAPPWAIELDSKLHILLEKVETLMSLSPQVQTLVDEVTANTNAVQAALAGLAAEATQITALQAQIAALPAGQPIDQADLDAITKAVTDLGATNTALTAAVPANVPPAA